MIMISSHAMHRLVLLLIVAGALARSQFQDEPLWHAQWHLHDSSETAEYWARMSDQIRVQHAWKHFNVTGRGVTLAIVDDGIDVAHPEFQHDYAADLSYDYNGNDANPSPFTHDSHGTQSAGVAVARFNGVCGAGTAPGATLVAVRLIALPVTDLEESEGLSHRMDVVDIYSNSWGPPDDGEHLDGPGPLTTRAMQRVVNRGRGGRGGIYVWAAGNGRQWFDSCAYDGFASSRLVIPVGAVDFFGQATLYSEWCAALLVSAPSSGTSGPIEVQHIATTQPHGRFGESFGDCCTDFGGTSAAAPMVSGVVALMLEARPDLGWRDVQQVLALSARQNDPTHMSWRRNGAGLWYSHAYGFGVVDAGAAVERALAWNLVPRESRYTAVVTPNDLWQPIADTLFAPATHFTLNIDAVDTDIIEFVELFVTIEHMHRGELEILLYSPAGTRSELALAHQDMNAHYDRWCFGSRAPMNEHARGEWRVSVRDVMPNHVSGVVTELELRVWVH